MHRPRPHRLRPAIRALILAAAIAASLAACHGKKEPDPRDKARASEPIHYTIRGRIDLEGGEDPTGVIVFCAGTSYSAYCDNTGAYAISAVPHGRYNLIAQKPGYMRTDLGETILLPVAAGAGPTEVSIPLVEMPRDPAWLIAAGPPVTVSPTGTVTGRVTLTDGRPPEQVRIAIAGADAAAQPDRDGVFRIDDVEPGAWRAVFELDGYETQERRVLVRSGQISPIRQTVEMRPEVAVTEGRGTILGQVLFLGAGGQVTDPVPGATVGIVENGETAQVGTDGSFVFESVEPGLYTLIADATGYKLRNKVQVRVGEDPATAIIFLQNAQAGADDRGGVQGAIRLSGAPDTPLVGIVVALTGSSHMGVTDAAGQFRLTDVPEGAYSLFCSREGFETLQLTGIDITAGKILDLGALEMARKTNPPRIVFFSPRDERAGITIEPTVILRIGFNRQMNLDSVRRALRLSPNATHTIRRGGGNQPAAGQAADVIEVLIDSAGSPAPLQFNTRYRVNLTDDAADIEGNSLDEPFEARFATGGLRVLNIQPPDGATNVPLVGRTALEIRFNGAVDVNTLTERNLDISPRPAAMQNTILMLNDNTTGWSTARIQMTWQYNTEYRVTLRSGIRTEDGVSFDQSPFRIRFKTEPIPRFPTPR